MAPRFKQVCFWFVLLPFGSWLAIIVIVMSIKHGWSWSTAQIAIGFYLVPLAFWCFVYYTNRVLRFEARMLCALRQAQHRVCASCENDLQNASPEGLCPECHEPYTPQSLFEHWEGGTPDQILPITWPPISERRLALAWWQWALLPMIVLAPLIMDALFPNLDSFVVIMLVLLAPIFAAIGGLVWYVMRGHHHDWRILQKQRFRRCPRCLRSLKHEADIGTCPRCETEYTPDWLERTWSIIYRKPRA
ncbi:MAG: hypothetical protein KIT19_09345 [Phycisphaeraceae bacterium]|nr:hypothetical protein [Phycisphaeraceae bacterium]